MKPSNRAKEMSFLQPHHAVELVERALDVARASVVCMAKNESKLFIAFQLFQEVWRRSKKAGKMVLLVDDESAQILKPFVSAVGNQSMLCVKTYFDEKDVMGDCSLPSCDIVVTKANIFLQILKAGIMNLMSINLIVFDKCHLASDANHPFALILKRTETCKLDSRPKIVGLSSEIQHYQACPQDIERFLNNVEKVFNCKAFISNDLLALNRYGEQAEEEVVYYACTPENDQLICELKEILQNAVLFLKDISTHDTTQECVMFVKHVVTECLKVLLLFGPQHTAYIAGIALKEIRKLEKKCTENHDVLMLQFCRTQMNLIVKMSEHDKSEGCKDNLTDLTKILLFHMATHVKPVNKEDCTYQSTSCCDNLEANSLSTDQPHVITNNLSTCADSKQLPELQPVTMATSIQSQTNCTVTSQESNVQTTYGAKNRCDDPLCVILVSSTIIAKALNSLINKLSNTIPEYSFLKSACVHGNRTKQGMFGQGCSDEMEDNVMVYVQDGSINVLVATFEVERELYARRCSLLIRQGKPKDYKHYLNVKKKLKSAGAKLVILVRQEEKTKAEESFKDFKRIESVLAERCPNSRQSCHEIKKRFDEDQLDAAYEPYGEQGAKVDVLSSISLVNSYCSKFPSSGVGLAIPVCRTKEVWTDNEVEFISTLYLPRNSPVYWPIKGSVTLKRYEVNEETVRKARIKSEMCVALETCRQLHKAGELSEELQPMFRFKMLSLTAETEGCECEVADSGIGMVGSLKRNRAYKRKFPSFLEDNFPLPDEPSFMYSISMELTKPWTFERAVRSQSKSQYTTAAYCLGILSRKPLPKLPGMLVFDRAGEVTATVTACSAQPFVPTTDQLSLLRRFTGYIFKDIAKPRHASVKAFPRYDPAITSSGYYIVLLKDASDNSLSSLNGLNHKEIAFDFIHSIEHALGSFDNPTDPPPAGIRDMEIFKDAVVTGVYNDKRPRYYVADICYDRSPADPFPNTEAAGTFAEYYQVRYGAEVTLDQPMLDVDHISSRLNFLLPRYQNTKGQCLAVPGRDSKRSQKSKAFVIPEMCSVHPLPGYLWRQLFILPALLYRVESFLVVEEFRYSVARALGRGALSWPENVPLPLLTLGEMVGEEVVSKKGCVPSKHSTELCEALSNVRISGEENLDMMVIEENLLSREKHSSSDALSASCCGLMAKHQESSLPASGEVNPSGANMNTSESEHRSVSVEHGASLPVDHNKFFEAVDSKASPVTIWTDPELSRLYQSCGPSSTLLLRALTTSSAGDVFSLERLEMLGDSFVKYAISTSVFFKHRHENEGKLSFIRGLKVSNRQLFYLARQRGLPSYMITRTFNLLVNWLPPGFYHEDDDSKLFLKPDKSSQECEDEDEDGSFFVQGESSGPNLSDNSEGSDSEVHYPSIQLSPYLHHCCSDKAIADATEALIGAYLLCYGPEGAWSLLEWFGMELTKPDDVQDDYTANTCLADDSSLEEVIAESDSTASSQDTSKRPCTACQSFDEPLLQLQRGSDLVAFDSGSLPSQTSTGVELTTLKETSSCSFSDKSQANGCEAFVQSEKRPDALASESVCLSSHTPVTAEFTTQLAAHSFNEALVQLQEKPTPCPCNSGLLSSHRSSADEFAALEKALNYRFNDHSLLLQAFTHTSLPRDYNTVLSSYEQLEFLGDAIIDFLVTHHLYMYHRHMSPGDLTDLRSAVVNNYSFAALAVKLGFAKHLRSLSPPLFGIVNKFIVKLKEKEMKQQQTNHNEIYSSVFVIKSEDGEESVEVEVPKVLGDLFEAVAGALYVDCGQDLDRVLQVYLPILKPSIDYYYANPPLSAIRKLLEMKPNASKFAPVERMVDGKFKSTLTVLGCGTFVGTGRNFRIAKSTAAQRALNALQQNRAQKKVKTHIPHNS